MRLPFYNAGRHSLSCSLILILALMLLVFTGLGVFRLYFGFDWMAGDNDTGQLFTLKIRGGQSFNLFEAAPFGRLFWLSQLVLLALSVLMPLFRLVGGTTMAVLSAVALVSLHFHYATESSLIPLEFELLILLLLYVIYVLLSYVSELRDRKRFNQLLSQYVPEELAREYRKDPQIIQRGGEERDVSVLFCDVIDFSSITGQLEPPQLTDWLNLFFSHTSRIVVRHRGTIDKYMGDSVMAVWGAPLHSTTHAFDALSAALDIQAELDKLNQKYKERNMPTAKLGIGICTGSAMVGPLGSEYRMDYTVVGDTVNVAQRLEAQTRKYQVPVIVGDSTAAVLPDMLFRELDTIEVKGREKAVTMYEPLGPAEEMSELAHHRLHAHNEAMTAIKAGNWEDAVSLFTQLRDEWGPKSMYDIYLRGIEQARRL